MIQADSFDRIIEIYRDHRRPMVEVDIVVDESEFHRRCGKCAERIGMMGPKLFSCPEPVAES